MGTVQEIKVGDWISFRSSGLVQRGKVIGVDDETYAVQLADLSGESLISGASAPLAKGDHLRKVPPPDEE